jgi:hypothetical protein
VADRDLLHRAATCYRRAGQLDDAARCYRGAALHREAAAVWESLGALAEAAADLADAGRPEHAAWLLVHRLGAAGPARALLAALPPTGETASSEPAPGERRTVLLRSLVMARCDVAEAGGSATPDVLAVLDTVLAELERPGPATLEHDVEQWAVEIAETVHRLDLVALLFAAAVRGGRHGADQRWNSWSVRTFGVPLVLPANVTAGAR